MSENYDNLKPIPSITGDEVMPIQASPVRNEKVTPDQLVAFIRSEGTYSKYPLQYSSPTPARNAEENIHGAFVPLVTGHDLDAGDLTLTGATLPGTGKLIIVVNTATDFDGTITVTGTTQDRNTGVETAAQVSTITVDSLTTDTSGNDSNGFERHNLSSAYITDKWFTDGTDVVIASTDTVITDIDVYQCSFEQCDDSPEISISTFDINFLCLATSAASLRLYTVEVTGDKVDITPQAEYIEAAHVADRPYRERYGNLDLDLDGTKSGLFVTAQMAGLSKFADLSIKVWVTTLV
jgi:hypothetical protein